MILNSCSVPGGGLFYAGGPASTWHVHYYGPSPAGCHLYTNTTSYSSPINWAAYYLPVETKYDGVYSSVREFIPCDSHSSAHSYLWYVYDKGTAYGYDSYLINIDTSCSVYQKFLFGYRFYENPDIPYGGYVKQVDNTGAAYYLMAADAMWYQK